MADLYLDRRSLLAAGAALSMSGTLLHAAGAAEPFGHRGVVYDTGTDFGYEGYLSRMSWHEADVRREMATIREQLHCTSVQIVGTDIGRLELASRIAHENGLAVWLQPRLMEKAADAQLAHMIEGAKLAGALEGDGVDLVFSVGCETTIFQHDLVPGDSFDQRATALFSSGPDGMSAYFDRLNAYLAQAAEAARRHFGGRLSYSAASWERVDWGPFDLVGVNLYRDRNNRDAYREALRSHKDHGKPLVITEFGACTFEGAADYGGGGFMIVDYSTEPPRIPVGFVRSEAEQAAEITELLTIFAEEEVAGAFVYVFLSQFDTHSDDPRQDMDMASHAIVKVMPGAEDAPIEWEPKEAFHAVADFYGDRVEG